MNMNQIDVKLINNQAKIYILNLAKATEHFFTNEILGIYTDVINAKESMLKKKEELIESGLEPYLELDDEISLSDDNYMEYNLLSIEEININAI